MRYTLKIARTDRGFTTHKFADLRACYAALDMLRQAGKVRRGWVYDREAAKDIGDGMDWTAAEKALGRPLTWGQYASGLIYSN